MTKVAAHRCRFVHYLSPGITQIKRYKNTLAVLRSNGTIQIWTFSTNWIHQATIPSSEPIQSIAFFSNRLFRGTLAGTVEEISLDTFQPIYNTTSFGGSIWCMESNPSNDVIALGCQDGSIRLFRITKEGLDYLSCLEKQPTRVVSLSWHPYKPILVVGSLDGTIRAVHADTGYTIHTMKLKHDTIIWDVRVLKNGMLVAADSNGSVSFWDGKTGTLLQNLQVHDADVLCLANNHEGTVVYSSGVDQKIVKMELVNGDWKHTGTKKVHTHDVFSILLLEEKPFHALVSGGVDTALTMSYPITEFETMKQDRLGIVPQGVCKQAQEPKFITTVFDDSCRVWKVSDVAELGDLGDHERINTDGHEQILTIKFKGKSTLTAGDISQDGTVIALADTQQIKVFSIEYDPVRITVLKTLEQGAYSLALADDKLIVGGFDGTVSIYDATWSRLSYKEHSKTITRLSASRCGSFVISADTSKRIVCYNVVEQKVFQFNQVQGILPTFNSPHNSFSVHPTDPILTITTSTNDIYEIDLESCKFTEWSNTHSSAISKWLSGKELIRGVLYLPDAHLFYGWSFVYVLKNGQAGKFEKKLDHRFQCIAECFWNDVYGEIVVVERPTLQLLSELPDAFRKKRFGG